MKVILRIPTADQFAFIEVEQEVATFQEAYEAYNEATAMVKVGAGLPDKEWNRVVDLYLAGKGMSADDMERMNSAQKWFIHQIDKSRNRTQ